MEIKIIVNVNKDNKKEIILITREYNYSLLYFFVVL